MRLVPLPAARQLAAGRRGRGREARLRIRKPHACVCEVWKGGAPAVNQEPMLLQFFYRRVVG
jgi:hypothetical protein